MPKSKKSVKDRALTFNYLQEKCSNRPDSGRSPTPDMPGTLPFADDTSFPVQEPKLCAS